MHIFCCIDLKSDNDLNERVLKYCYIFLGTIDQITDITVLFERRLKRMKVIMESRESEFAAVACSPSALGVDLQ